MTEYTVAGYSLAECPTGILEREVEAGRDIRDSGWHNDSGWEKLYAIEAELARRAKGGVK